MLPFIHGIADTYVRKEQTILPDCCFVFPNKRSATFFHHAYAQACNDNGVVLVHPATLTISDFITSMAQTVQPDRMEKIFILYEAFREIIRENVPRDIAPEKLAVMLDFNRFLRWADMILGDFNDVDMYCVDPEEIFPNVKYYNEISTNYISDDVIREIRKHWKSHAGRYTSLDDRFWNHIDHRSPDGTRTDKSTEFFRLWQILLPLYRRFNAKIDTLGMSYPGKACRQAIDRIDSTPADRLDFSRYIFVGFNMLSTAEQKLFALLRDKPAPSPVADFYFDDASPVFNSRRIPGHATATAVKNLKKKFPPLYPEAVKPVRDFPEIEIIGIPSRVGQMKLTGDIIRELYPRELAWCNGAMAAEEFKEQLRRTAVVLPQETLAIGIMSALPSWLSPVNFTMGYRLRDSNIATLVRDIISMHHRSRSGSSGIATFFCEDVRKVLSHPLILQYFQRESQAIDRHISEKHLFNVVADDIVRMYPELKPVFTYTGQKASPDEIMAYFSGLFQWLRKYVEPAVDNAISDDGAVTDIDGTRFEKTVRLPAALAVDYMLVHQYENSIVRLRQLISLYGGDGFSLTESTFYQMIERLIGAEVVPLEGRPLEGLQVMGVLEARNLDFENLIIPSMNERIFPRRHYQKSLIPPALRYAYGMSTQEHQETIFSYYFYRMISRARRVFLLYDTRSDGLGRGQMSRYLVQLLHLFHPEGITVRNLGFTIEAEEPYGLTMPKTGNDAIIRQIERYRTAPEPGLDEDAHASAGNSCARYLSASTINEYINCPLMFFLKNIAGFSREDEILDYLDEGTYGTIVHEIIQQLYSRFESHTGRYTPGERVTAETLTGILKVLDTGTPDRPNEIERLIIRAINKHYNRFSDDVRNGILDTPLTGDAEIFFHVIRDVIRRFLIKDRKAGPFRYVSGEHRHSTGPEQFTIGCPDSTGDELKFNLTYTIDRIDIPDGADDSDTGVPCYRIIDYKTGSDPVEAAGISDLFSSPHASSHRAKAILQLMLYCQAYARELEEYGRSRGRTGMGDAPMSPWIYSLRKMSKKDFTPVKIGTPASGPQKPASGGGNKRIPVDDYRLFVDDFNAILFEYLHSLFDTGTPFTQADDDSACTYCKFTQICRRSPRKA